MRLAATPAVSAVKVADGGEVGNGCFERASMGLWAQSAQSPSLVLHSESMTPEPYRSSVSGPDGLRVASDHVRVDPDALGPTTDVLSG